MTTLPSPQEPAPAGSSLTPREIVAELDKYVVGQARAKRAVAIALRNRYRRQRLSPDLAEEVAPKNILMIGPTGVGKTEIARRLARLAQSPFLKIEASKFTEVGYVGRDVESMVRDLVGDRDQDGARGARSRGARQGAPRGGRTAPGPAAAAVERLAAGRRVDRRPDDGRAPDRDPRAAARAVPRRQVRREDRGDRDARPIDAVVRTHPGLVNRGNRRQPARHDARHVPGPDAEPADVRARGVRVPRRRRKRRSSSTWRPCRARPSTRVEDAGIIFLDEIDKIAGREGAHGPDVSREGVQRDILPIVEGTTVNTKYGMVRTDHILFIAAGAFHVSKPSDLIPELQGRFPIRVELDPLGKDEFVRILTEPRNALIKQYMALMDDRGRPPRLCARRDRTDRGTGHARQRTDGEHRRAPAAHGAGAAAGRSVVSRARTRRPIDYD